MKKETLKKLRIVIPGVFCLIMILPLFQETFSLESLKKAFDSISGGVLYMIIVAGVGGLYYISDIRGIFLRESLYRIHQNIKLGLLGLCYDDAEIMGAFKKLMEGRTLILVFYGFIDKDESLKEKAKNVYFNGLVWSTVADITALSAIGLIIYLIGFFVAGRSHFLWIALAAAVLHLFCEFACMPRVTNKHIDLGSEEIEHIGIHCRAELNKRLRELA